MQNHGVGFRWFCQPPRLACHSAARHFIPRIWHVDPLGCPVCQNPLRVIAAIDDPRVVEKTLRHLALWNDPPPSPPGPAGFSPVGGEGDFGGRTGNWK
jgi:hypothetical protein